MEGDRFLGPSSLPQITTFLREVYEKDEKHHILSVKRQDLNTSYSGLNLRSNI